MIAGGAAFGVAPEALSDELGVEHAVAGDGERATPALIAELAAGRAPGAIPRRGATRGWAPRAHAARRRRRARLAAARAHALLARPQALRASRRHRADPDEARMRFKCIDCTYLNVEGWGYRLREPELVADEIAELASDARIRHFEFVDSTFNARRDTRWPCARRSRAASCACISTLPTSLPPPRSPSSSPMRHAGFQWLGITAESASDPVLEKLQKGSTSHSFGRSPRMWSRAGMGVLWIFLIGGPGETPATLEETLKFAAWAHGSRGTPSISRGTSRVSRNDAAHTLRWMRAWSRAETRCSCRKFYFSEQLQMEATLARLRDFAARHPRFMFSADSRSPLLPYLTRLASALRLPRPHWRYMGVFQRLSRSLS